MNRKIVILGAGPTGLGAAYRLNELKYKNFVVLEKENYVGGLSTSFIDKKKFTWDIGGHVIHSHFKYFDNVLNQNLINQKYSKKRNAYVFFENKLIPYPFQNHIHLLSPIIFLECLLEIIRIKKNEKSKNFLEFINFSFGKGIARHFLLPYNRKIWAYPLSKMSTSWVSERVSTIKVTNIIKDIFTNNSKGWGPNRKFIYPKHGTGSLWKEVSKKIGQDKIKLNQSIDKIDTNKKLIYLTSGKTYKYDYIISSIPMDTLINKIIKKPNMVQVMSKKLIHNTVVFFGLALKRRLKNDFSWIYYPQKNIPFYRLTYLSNYSRHLVPNKSYSSVLVEISTSQQIKEKLILNGLIRAKIIDKRDLDNISNIWTYKADYAYPIPTLKRDKTLKIIQKYLISQSILSRGRFGAWKYEISNMDHSFMQGVEAVNKILLKKEESIWTL